MQTTANAAGDSRAIPRSYPLNMVHGSTQSAPETQVPSRPRKAWWLRRARSRCTAALRPPWWESHPMPPSTLPPTTSLKSPSTVTAGGCAPASGVVGCQACNLRAPAAPYPCACGRFAGALREGCFGEAASGRPLRGGRFGEATPEKVGYCAAAFTADCQPRTASPGPPLTTAVLPHLPPSPQPNAPAQAPTEQGRQPAGWRCQRDARCDGLLPP
jgi:hypothetical protein